LYHSVAANSALSDKNYVGHAVFYLSSDEFATLQQQNDDGGADDAISLKHLSLMASYGGCFQS
jgi:hypothetical protein